jgi:hypothetical protein
LSDFIYNVGLMFGERAVLMLHQADARGRPTAASSFTGGVG